MAYLNAPADAQRTGTTVGARVASPDIAQVGAVRAGKIPIPVEIHPMRIHFIGPGAEIADIQGSMIS